MGKIEEIKVGEYVRTTKGEIHKVIKIQEDEENPELWNYYSFENDIGEYIEQIKKHSKDIIDLIEVGDYVNGELVTGFGYEDVNGAKEKSILIEGKYTKVSFALLEWDIKSIVTKEMFSDIEYRLEN